MSFPDVVADERAAAGVLHGWPAFSGRPHARKTHISDTTEIETLFHPAQCIQLSPGRFSGTSVLAEIGPVRVFEHACNCGIQLRKQVGPDHILIGYAKSAEDMLEHGRPWSAQEMLIATGTEIHLSMLAPADIVWLDVRLDRLAQSQREGLQRSVVTPMFLASTKSSPFEQLFRYVAQLLESSPTELSPLQSESTWKRVGIDLVFRIGRALDAARAEGIEAKYQRRSFSLAQRVERFMWENVEEPLKLEQICTNLHCRMRSLIYSFKDSFGLAPITYLKIRRLNAVHRELMAGRGGTRIFDVAADFGFWHMGHFSADYKRMFGSSASETVAASRRRVKN